MLLLIAVLSVGQLVAFAPTSVAATPHMAALTTDMALVMNQHGHDADLLDSEEQSALVHHLSGAHCLGCGLADAGYTFRIQAVTHVAIVAVPRVQARSLRISLFRPPITALN